MTMLYPIVLETEDNSAVSATCSSERRRSRCRSDQLRVSLRWLLDSRFECGRQLRRHGVRCLTDADHLRQKDDVAAP